jgi:site-specific recombinase XerD
MTHEKEKMLLSYMDYLRKTKALDHVVGARMRHVTGFLDSDYPVTKKGWSNYRQHLSVTCNERNFSRACESVCEFLSFLKINPERKKKRAYKPLNTLSEISERNQNSLKTFLEWLSNENLSSRTVFCYKARVLQFFKYSSEASREQFKRYIATLEEKGVKPGTVNAGISGLNKYADFMKKPEWKLPLPKLTRKLDISNIPSEREYQKLTDYLKGKDMECYYQVRIMASTGARISELLQFTWEYVIAGSVDLKGKGNKYRRFFFPKDLSKEVALYAGKHRKSGQIFVNRRTGLPLSDRGWSSRLRQLGEQAGIEPEKMHTHAFRHFFAVMYLKKNKDIVQLADLMGHERVDTTRIYLQKSFEEQKRDYNKTVNW